MEEELKRCAKCGKELPLSKFNRSTSSRDGLRASCRDCDKKYYYCSQHTRYVNLALDRMPWPYNDDKHEMDMEAIKEYKEVKRFKR